MSIKTSISIACASAFWGDSPLAVEQVLLEPKLDYIVFDYLSEVTMALLTKLKKRDPNAGYIADFLTDVIEPHLETISTRGIRLIANAGGMNPLALKERIEVFAKEKNLNVHVACVRGDDVLERLNENQHQGLASANAYLGAPAIVKALELGATIVITGRIVDTALVVAPVMHSFDFNWNDYDFLAQASLAGHIVECGTQCCGGNFTDWQTVPGKDNVGFPILRFFSNGRFEISKPPTTGGLVSTATVAEQIVYEISNPARYLLPDVICDFSNVQLSQKSPNVVEVIGARGHQPTDSYKISATSIDGWKISSTAFIAGGDAKGKARLIGETILQRCSRELTERGKESYSETLIEAVGGLSEALLRISAAHSEPSALEIIAKEIAPAATSLAPGLTHLLGGRAQPTPRVKFSSFLMEKNLVPLSICSKEQITEFKLPLTLPASGRSVDQSGFKANFPSPTHLTSRSQDRSSRTIDVPLSEICFARSGDKGNDVNIGVIARSALQFADLKQVLTSDRVREVFAFDFDDQNEKKIEVWELPGICALNFVLKNVLGGGGAYSLRLDAQGKAFAQRLLDITIPFAKELV